MNRKHRLVFIILGLAVAGMVFYMLLQAVAEMPPYGQPDNPTINEVVERYVEKGVEESGGLNLITNIILDYRGYDTLLETTVLFTAVMAIILVLSTKGESTE
ncbi:MAG: hydrogen gas-evolving membrane-bound hydrogenase subunit E [Dethiobacteria bacterium]